MSVALLEERTSEHTALDVQREDLRFFNVTPDRVRIEITVRNPGEARSEPAPLHVQSAPLGAFLPWRLLTSLTVPAIQPGAEVQLQTEVSWPRIRPRGESSQDPPQNVLTATESDDSADPRPDPLLLERDLRRRSTKRRMSISDKGALGLLAPDVVECFGHRNPHWAGNINVFIGECSVERHMAQALRVYPGRTNTAWFFVGTGQDAYMFSLEGSSLAQYSSLAHHRYHLCLPQGDAETDVVPEGQWIEAGGRLAMTLVMKLPETCHEGSLMVHVAQRSSGKNATVEFSLDADAAGPGCFTL